MWMMRQVWVPLIFNSHFEPRATRFHTKQTHTHTHTPHSPNGQTPKLIILFSAQPTLEILQSLLIFPRKSPPILLRNPIHGWGWGWGWGWCWWRRRLLGTKGRLRLQRRRGSLRLGFHSREPLEEFHRFVRLSRLEFPRLPCPFCRRVRIFLPILSFIDPILSNFSIFFSFFWLQMKSNMQVLSFSSSFLLGIASVVGIFFFFFLV